MAERPQRQLAGSASPQPPPIAEEQPDVPPKDLLSLPPLEARIYYGVVRPTRIRGTEHAKEGPVHFWKGTRPGSKTLVRRARSETPSKGRTVKMNLSKLFGASATDDAVVELLRPDTIADEFRRERRAPPPRPARRPAAPRRRLSGARAQVLPAPERPLVAIRKSVKKRPEKTAKERRLEKLRVEFDSIFSEDELERQFAILKITDISREALKEIRDLMWSRFPELRGIFFTYARMDATGPQEVETISSQEYMQFCKDCQLFDKKFFTQAIANLIFVAINHEEELGAGRDDKDLAGPLRSGRRDYDSDQVFTLSEFLASLIRISVLKYGTRFTDPSFRLRHLITTDIIPRARQDQKEALRRLLIEPVVHDAIRSYRRQLHRVFTQYAAADEADAMAINKLNVKEFIKLFEDARLTGPDLTLREVREAFALAQADPGDDDEDSEEGAGGGGGGDESGDDDNSQMTFNEFVEGVCRCADAKYGAPCEDPEDDEERSAQLAASVARFCGDILRGLEAHAGATPAAGERGRGGPLRLPRLAK
eukprot:tig00001127_g7135.t1